MRSTSAMAAMKLLPDSAFMCRMSCGRISAQDKPGKA